MLDKQEAFMSEKAAVVASGLVFAAVPAVDNDALLDVSEDGD